MLSKSNNMCPEKNLTLYHVTEVRGQRSGWSSIKISGDLSFATKQQNRLQNICTELCTMSQRSGVRDQGGAQ